MTSNLPHSQAAVRRIVAIAVLILTVVMTGGVAVMAYAAIATDRAQASGERELVAHRLDGLQAELLRDTAALSPWDAAYDRLAPATDALLILDPAGELVHARTAEAAAPLAQALRPLILQMREQAAVDRRLTNLAGQLDTTITRSGVVVVRGRPYLVAAVALRPSERLLIRARAMDEAFLRRLSEDLRLGEARLVTGEAAGGEASTPIIDVNGRRVADLAWTPKRPGRAALQGAAPLFMIVLALLLVAAVALAGRVRLVLREMAASDGALDRTMAELVRARDQANAASVAKSQFLANMSHEIRTPLNGILGMTQVMGREDLSPAQSERLAVITQSSQTLLAVLNDVLDISKIEAGRLEIDDHAFDLAEAVEGACGPFASLAARKGVALNLEIDASVRGVWWGDGARLRQILANLVSNAVKFTAEGQVTVVAGPSGLGLRFTVRDTGIGVPKDRQGDLFQKFSQVDASTTRRFGGTGLGLAICKELAELMGGRMWVESEVGQGSSFSFDLPLRRAAEGRGVAPSAPPAAPRSGHARILAAEDNATNQLILTSLLEPFGVELVLVENGRQAVEAWRAGDFDLILMDVQMPEMNGVEATAAIRALEAERGARPIPILALSANVMSHQVKTYLAAGMTGFVPKPIEAGKLVAAMDDALATAEATVAAA